VHRANMAAPAREASRARTARRAEWPVKPWGWGPTAH
jgi:hypothetical protein